MYASWCRCWNQRLVHGPLLLNGVAYNHSDSDLFWNTLLFPRTVFLSFATIRNGNSFLHKAAVRVIFFGESETSAASTVYNDWKATAQWYGDYLLIFGYRINLPERICNWVWGVSHVSSWDASAPRYLNGAKYDLQWCGHNLILQFLM